MIASAVITGTANRKIKGDIVNEYQSEPTIAYYDEKKCDGGQDCVIRLGHTSAAPKIIVVGDQQLQKNSSDKKPRIIYPPVN